MTFSIYRFISPDASTSRWQCTFPVSPGKTGGRPQNYRSASFPYLRRILVLLRSLRAICGETKSAILVGFSVLAGRDTTERGCRAHNGIAPQAISAGGARPGTISPWSTKATDIARHCGLERWTGWSAVSAFISRRKMSLLRKFPPTCRRCTACADT